MHHSFFQNGTAASCAGCAFSSFSYSWPPCASCENGDKKRDTLGACSECIFLQLPEDSPVCQLCSDRAEEYELTAFTPNSEEIQKEAGCRFCTSYPEGTSRCDLCEVEGNKSNFRSTTSKKKIEELSKQIIQSVKAQIQEIQRRSEEGEKKEMAQNQPIKDPTNPCASCKYRNTGGQVCGTCEEIRGSQNWVADPLLVEEARRAAMAPTPAAEHPEVVKEEEKRGMSKVFDGLKKTGGSLKDAGLEGFALAGAQTTTQEFVNAAHFALKAGLKDNYPEAILEHPITKAIEPGLLAALSVAVIDMFGDQMKVPKKVQKAIRTMGTKTFTAEVKDNSQEIYDTLRPFVMILAEKAKDFVIPGEEEETEEASQEAALPRKGEGTQRAEDIIAELRAQADRLEKERVVLEREEAEQEAEA